MEIKGWRECAERISARFPDREMLSIEEAAQVVGCVKNTLLADGTFPKRRVGNRWKISISSLARWMVTV